MCDFQLSVIECNSMAGMDCSTTCGFGESPYNYSTLPLLVSMIKQTSIHTGLQDVIFMCILYDSEGPGTPIDISEVPFSVEPLIGRRRVCTTSDAENNVVIW